MIRFLLHFACVAFVSYFGVGLHVDAQDSSVRQTQGELELVESNSDVTIKKSGRVMLTYNKVSPPVPEGMNPAYARSGFLHPVATPAQRVVTAMFPPDHAHQHGIFTAWVQTRWDGRDIDFWNLAGGTGRVLHERIVTTFGKEGMVGFEADLIHRAELEPKADVLRERWRISAFTTDQSCHGFDLETTQNAITDKPLVVKEYHYGGVAFRGLVRWLSPKDSYAKAKASQLNLEACDLRNDQGSDRDQGNHEHTRWVGLTGKVDGQDVTIYVLSHRDNFRAPQAARLHATKPYFVFSPCVDGEFVIDRDHPYRGRYRYLITDAPMQSTWVQKQWDDWHIVKP
jgi:hypothetical protein